MRFIDKAKMPTIKLTPLAVAQINAIHSATSKNLYFAGRMECDAKDNIYTIDEVSIFEQTASYSDTIKSTFKPYQFVSAFLEQTLSDSDNISLIPSIYTEKNNKVVSYNVLGRIIRSDFKDETFADTDETICLNVFQHIGVAVSGVYILVDKKGEFRVQYIDRIHECIIENVEWHYSLPEIPLYEVKEEVSKSLLSSGTYSSAYNYNGVNTTTSSVKVASKETWKPTVLSTEKVDITKIT